MYVAAVLKASELTATWQYLHYIYAHLYDDALHFGMFDTTDDSILEHGNRSVSKNLKRIVFQTANLDAGTTWSSTRTVEETDQDGKKTGELKKVTVVSPVNDNAAVQVHRLKWAGAELKHRRTPCPVAAQSVLVQGTKRLKQEERADSRKGSVSALEAIKKKNQ